MKNKTRYSVYAKTIVFQGDNNIHTSMDWHLVGTTYAVSEKQAINNVRHRCFGDSYSSQHKAVYADPFRFESMHRLWKAVSEEVGD